MNLLKKNDPDGPSSWRRIKIERDTVKLQASIYEQVKKLFGQGDQSILIILQGMDASGKDGLIRELFKNISPMWVDVHSFKKPTSEEYAHDFLWRIHKHVPEKGKIAVFNRSQYEDLLVPRVEGTVPKAQLDKRYRQINDFERMLEENGTRIIKIYLNLSYEVQERKLRERIDTPEKHWKHNDHDWVTREKWSEYMQEYERIFEKCNEVPWHIVPCNKNWTKLYAVAKVLDETLKKMHLAYPPLESSNFLPNYEKAKITY